MKSMRGIEVKGGYEQSVLTCMYKMSYWNPPFSILIKIIKLFFKNWKVAFWGEECVLWGVSFWDMISLCSPRYPRTHHVDQANLKLPEILLSVSQALGLKVCLTMPGLDGQVVEGFWVVKFQGKNLRFLKPAYLHICFQGLCVCVFSQIYVECKKCFFNIYNRANHTVILPTPNRLPPSLLRVVQWHL